MGDRLARYRFVVPSLRLGAKGACAEIAHSALCSSEPFHARGHIELIRHLRSPWPVHTQAGPLPEKERIVLFRDRRRREPNRVNPRPTGQFHLGRPRPTDHFGARSSHLPEASGAFRFCPPGQYSQAVAERERFPSQLAQGLRALPPHTPHCRRFPSTLINTNRSVITPILEFLDQRTFGLSCNRFLVA